MKQISKRILFVINPISGSYDKNNLIELIEKKTANLSGDSRIYYTTGANDKTKISLEIADFQPGKVIVAGGDGTCNMVAQLLIGRDIQMGIIPVGSANGLAKELQLPSLLRNALQVALDGQAKPIDVLKINEKHYCLHLSDIGLNARIVKRFEKESVRGWSGYARQFFREFFNRKTHKFRFQTGIRTFTQKAEMVVIANATKYGTGAIINPTGKIDDGQFEICIIKPFPVWAIFTITLAFFTGALHKQKHVKIISTDTITIYNPKHDNVQIDGEIIGNPTEIKASILTSALTVIVPKEDENFFERSIKAFNN